MMLSTPGYKIRRELIAFISQWQFYNANNMDLHQIRNSEPKIGGNDIYLSTSGNNLPLINLTTLPNLAPLPNFLFDEIHGINPLRIVNKLLLLKKV